MNILAWLVVGLIAGWLAGVVTKGGGYGLVGDIAVGVAGALLAGFVSGLLFGSDYVSGINLTTIGIAFLGAIVLVALTRVLHGRSRVF